MKNHLCKATKQLSKWLKLLFNNKPSSMQKTVVPDKATTLKPKELLEEPVVFHRLSAQGNNFYITERLPYSADGALKPQTIEKVFDFAYRMAFTSEGEHRNNRSGGDHNRRNGEIFANTFQGKIAECAACNYFYKFDKSVYPDFSVYKLGEWDTVDLTVCGKEIAIKSTKHFGQLLLLETKDWDKNGNYIPNIDKSVSSYDYLVLIRMKPSCEEILKQNSLFYSDFINREDLHRLVTGRVWSYNYVGYITKSHLIQIIRDMHILPRGSLLNGSTKMDAENYYVQAGDMRDLTQFEEQFH